MRQTMMNQRRPILGGSVAAMLMLLGTPAYAVPEDNTIELSNCTLSMPGTPATAAARCGYLEVPENPDDPEGPTIRLHVAVGDSNSQTPAADPVFFLAGGPGQAASETWVMIRSTLRKVRKNRDIIMVDQRGTGQSNQLQCPAPETMDLEAAIDLDEIRRESERCLADLDGDPRFYTTTIAMQDIDRVRRAMGYDQINLVGVSYGTRAAQVYLRQFPETVRSVVLDSVVPMQLALGQEHAPMLDAAVDQVLDDCAADSNCAALFPDERQALDELFLELRENPRYITITDPLTGQPQSMLLNAETLAVAIRFLSYSSETQALLPLLINEAVETGQLERLASQALLVMSGLSEALSRGMELSVVCSEDYPFMNLGADQSDTLLGNVMLQVIEAQCSVWPQGPVPDDFHEPVISDVPVLLVSGERDPVTPPRYAAQAAESFSNHVNLVAGGQAHSVMQHQCVQDVIADFIEAGSITGLDTSCFETIEASPFFTTLLGPEP
jgi:pimeloyl-ACP methyl ester carboxylesterase